MNFKKKKLILINSNVYLHYPLISWATKVILATTKKVEIFSYLKFIMEMFQNLLVKYLKYLYCFQYKHDFKSQIIIVLYD